MPAGRPTIYCDALAKRICNIVASNTLGLRKLLDKYPDLPHEDTIRVWRLENEEFSALYHKAKARQADLLAEECLEIADDCRNDFMESFDDNEDGKLAWKVNSEAVNRSRLRIDTRKFFASKLLPKVYGDQKQVEDLQHDKARLQVELDELRAKLDAQNKKEY